MSSKKVSVVSRNGSTTQRDSGKLVLVSFAQCQIWKTFEQLWRQNEELSWWEPKNVAKFTGADIVDYEDLCKEFEEFKNNKNK